MPCPVYHAGQISLRKGSIKLVDPPRNICSSLFLQLRNNTPGYEKGQRRTVKTRARIAHSWSTEASKSTACRKCLTGQRLRQELRQKIRNSRLDGQFISSLRTISCTINEAERPAAETSLIPRLSLRESTSDYQHDCSTRSISLMFSAISLCYNL